MRHAFIAGASRGIGLRLGELYAADGWDVWGIGRSAAPEAEFPNVRYASFDARTFEPQKFAGVREPKFSRLILNSAVFGPNPPNNLDLGADGLRQILDHNVVGHFRVFKQMLPHMSEEGDGKIAFVISRAGVHSAIKGRAAIAYRVSKSAQIALALSVVDACRERNIAVYLVNPGWVQTRIGGKNARLSPAESAAGVKAVIEAATLADTGAAFNFDGKRMQL